MLPVLRWFLAPSDSFSDEEARAVEGAFKRYQVPHTREMHRDFLGDLLRFLGYPRTPQERVLKLLSEVSTFTELDVEEVQSFVGKFAHSEHERLRRLFQTLADPEGGRLPAGRVEEFMVAAGMLPDRHCLAELVAEGQSGAGRLLSFSELLELVAGYQRSQGLAQRDVARLRRIFRSLESQPARSNRHGQRSRGAKWRKAAEADPSLLPGLPLDSLMNAAIVAFGPSVEAPLARVLGRLGGGEGPLSPGGQNELGGELLSFAEVLALARLAREVHLEDIRAAYDRHCDGRRCLPGSGLPALLRSLDLEPLDRALAEIRPKVGLDAHRSDLSFADAAAVARCLEETGGLLACEVEELRAAFGRSAQGELVAASAMTEFLQGSGFTPLDGDLHLFAARCELNHAGMLEWPEFLKVMAAHRNEELKRLRKLYCSQGDDEATLNTVGLGPEAALDALRGAADGYIPPLVFKAVSANAERLDWDSFVKYADLCRKRGAEARRQNAGFKESEIASFRLALGHFDKEGTGVVTTTDLQAVLDRLGISVRTREEHRAMRERLDEARQAAREAGAKGVTAPNAATFGFWELVQLVRLLQRESSRAAQEDAGRAAEELRFSVPEQAQFRRIFSEWSRLESGLASPGQGGAAAAESDGVEGGISVDTLHRLLRSIGLQTTREQKKELEAQVAALGLGRRGPLAFVDFLRMMRWLLDSDFAGINGVAASTAAQKQREKSTSTVLS